ncbi:sigma-54-dependent transcriptional regulator [Halodesulfovibrio marinisediminis]|uniref:Two-component system, NtrC family, response regulator HydG n=1 Tax=Halodesulfovibrio marinisediminis DSM 17456 TaxID=1121457 RepID=A0A1N6EWM9_9BACT|nr:sigma-54 dependent transcriptional regulator [Halodesulfovibrio marinisediminis]SIN87465.1 two-component system, NtrC family, response regulator HydG [Halodesulfovibrio marinisediminis DSM 17456]
MSAQILVVDDDLAHRSMLKTIIKGWGYDVAEADDGDVAVSMVRNQSYDSILMDIRMVNMDGITALELIKEYNPSIPILIMTAFSSVDTAVKALKIGAYDYLTKPLDFDVLKLTLERMLDHTRLVSENEELRSILEPNTMGMVGNSEVIKELRKIIATIAPSDASVLITGESGTGKELVANAIHNASSRADEAFVAINCAALSENLLESELFGHERGAFTGADKRREGRFVQADGGTLFLDEVGEIPVSLQPKLLRALQQGEVQRVGSDTVEKVDVRVIAATNRDLPEEVENGNFREDLYYRLNVIALRVPALRERPSDIPLLAEFFVKKYSNKNRKTIKGLAPQAMDTLIRYAWPGNVRELENVIERAVIMTMGEYISTRELPLSLSAKENEAPVQPAQHTVLTGMSLDELERKAILATLEECEYNKSKTARRLGITRATLHNKLKRYGFE